MKGGTSEAFGVREESEVDEENNNEKKVKFLLFRR